jgi:IclR family transcriptional regulator, KDG regulon repressor
MVPMHQLEDVSASNSLERALKLLEIIGRTPGGLNNKEISSQLHIATSSSSYILSRLERDGYVIRDETGRYKIGLKVLALASGVLRELGFHCVAGPVLHRLTEATRLSSYMGVLGRNQVLVVEKVESPEFVKSEVDIGTELPTHSTSLGKMLMAHLPQSQLIELVEGLELEAKTPHTILSKPDLKRQLQMIRKEGFATSEEEAFTGTRSVAAPILDERGTIRAAIAVAGHCSQAAWLDFPNLVAMVQVAARDLSRNLRGQASGSQLTNARFRS